MAAETAASNITISVFTGFVLSETTGFVRQRTRFTPT